MHYKRRKRKAFKGHCILCSYRNTDGTRRRLPTQQEKASHLSEQEQKKESR